MESFDIAIEQRGGADATEYLRQREGWGI